MTAREKERFLSDLGMPPLLTVAEAAQWLRKSQRTVRRWLGDGIIARRIVTPGGGILIPRAEIARSVSFIGFVDLTEGGCHEAGSGVASGEKQRHRQAG